MIEPIEIAQIYEPIELDHSLSVEIIHISDKGIERVKIQPNELPNRRHDHSMISLPMTLMPDNHSMVVTRSCENSELLSSANQQYILEQLTKGKQSDAVSNCDKRLKYGILTLKPYNKDDEYLLPHMEDRSKMFSQQLFSDINHNQISTNHHDDDKKNCPLSNEKIKMVVGVIDQVKDENDQFAKIQVTKALKNTFMRANDINQVLEYLLEVTKSLIHIDVPKPATGRPPLPRFQIIWGKTEYFPERNKMEKII